MITRKQLERFVKARNKSGFNSNLQFQIDANAAGFSVDDLGKPEVFILDGFKGYRWNVPIKDGPIMMIEFGRTIYLNGDRDENTISMMSLMHKAEWQSAPVE